MLRTLLLPVLFILSLYPTFALTTSFSGNAAEMAGKKLILYTYQDYLVFTDQELAQTTADPEGKFALTFDISETTLVFFHYGRNMLYLYAEPGHHYQVLLPPLSPLTDGDLLNPYFREEEVMLGVVNADTASLNAQIARFDDAWGPVFATWAHEVYNRSSYRIVDSIARSLDSKFSLIQNSYFNTYKRYKLGMLRNVVLQFKARSLADQYFYNQPVLSNNPAYMELFHQFFTDYFQRFSSSAGGNKIYQYILNEKSYSAVDHLLRNDSVLVNDTLRGLVLLKNLHDEFYNGSIPRASLLVILDSLISMDPVQNQRDIAKRIRGKVVRLMPGYEPPAFSLYDRNGKLVNLSDFKGKYVYLGFCNCFSYSCLKEFEMLKNLYAKHRDRFVIITISADSELEKMKDFLSKNDYGWTFLNYLNQPSVLKDYDIRAFPTYFVIGPDGRLLLSPAPGPGENIEMYMFKLMRDRGDL